MSNTINTFTWRLFCLLIITVSTFECQSPPRDELAGLTLDELEMLDDFELKLLRDFVKGKGRGSVSRAAKDEEISLFGADLPKMPANDTGLVDLSVSFYYI